MAKNYGFTIELIQPGSDYSTLATVAEIVYSPAIGNTFEADKVARSSTRHARRILRRAILEAYRIKGQPAPAFRIGVVGNHLLATNQLRSLTLGVLAR